MFSREVLEDALTRVGERLYADATTCRVVVVGGAALSLLGVINRATSDVDVIGWQEAAGRDLVPPPTPLPKALVEAVEAVRSELRLVEGWFDLRVASDWQLGLPVGFLDRVKWREYGRGLVVGLAGRQDLICLKLVAAADEQHPRHERDLLQLAPTDAELEIAIAESHRTNSETLWPSVERVAARVRASRHG